MGKTYASPSAFRAALKQAAVNTSRRTGMSVSDLMKIFYFNRLAARVFTKAPEDWLIKGGQALLVRYRGAARLSQDIDLQCAHPGRSAEELGQSVIEAASLDLGDHLRYVPGRYEGHSDEGRGAAQHFRVHLGNALVENIKVDLVVGRPLSGVPETRTLKSAVDIEWPVDWPDIRLYPVVDHIADKVCAMYERHGADGRFGSNRYRDLADLLLMSQQEVISGEAARKALRREAERRRKDGIRVVLPSAFEAPGPDWATGYPPQAALVLGLEGCRTYPEAARAAAAFLNPVLDATAVDVWNPRTATWG
ncbi:nucleotidyl transferase AbiEii/AbiGii toxin family protein [Streptomyces alkaliphilus]|uniref:nucleotidyl transferase AbiEii/AbiGii toxin family protein n=1 Tax=Streptomyces alkaliphilus TaxID=1472722 RepID=UPI00117C63EB|nr:nucleotidyl transferase AbiEii/AbiGii toxin family protein [Streptomyces alkaliphilus]MQS07939.1 nucleotidyl transferase AbiEii/AbiGii toxin family protein [Streptomyces alkaliphilus]